MGTPDPIVDLLRQQRRVRLVSVRQLAKVSGLNSASISEWENGHHEPTLTNLRRWARALGFDVTLGFAWPVPPTPDGTEGSGT